MSYLLKNKYGKIITNKEVVSRKYENACIWIRNRYLKRMDWRFISHMILYMFQRHSPKSSHPHPLPQCPKDCSIHLCLFCCLTYRDDRGCDGWMVSPTRWTWFEWTPGVVDGQGGLACWDSWGLKESDTTEWLNWYRVIITIFLNSTYICYYTVLVFFFLAYFTLYNRLQFHLPH